MRWSGTGLKWGRRAIPSAKAQWPRRVVGRSQISEQAWLKELMAAAELVPIAERIAACRDPTDDKFLELAVNGHADLIVSGDGDLLALNPFRDIPIVTPAAFVQEVARQRVDPVCRQPGLARRFAIALKERERLVGGVGLDGSTGDDNQRPALGYWLGEPYWGNGYAREPSLW